MIIMWIIAMLLSMVMTAYVFKKIELGKMIILGADFFFSFYVIAAGILIHKDTFSINSALIITLVIEIIIIVAITMFRGFIIPKITLNIKKYIPIIVVLIAAAIISSSYTSEAYGTGQDEGLYQIRAWYYMTDSNANVLDFSEYYNIEKEVEKKQYIQYINHMDGYYRLFDDDITDYKVGAAKGVTHGILTFPALMGLWGKMFGIGNMNSILTVMFLLAIANVWLTCGNLKLKHYVGIVSSLAMAICPILIWSSRTVLTEIVLAVFISTFFVLITESKKADKGILSSVPIVAACYYHVTITILIPMVVIVYICMIFASRKPGYAVGLIISMIGYVAGFFMMWTSSHAYAYSSFEQIFNMTKNLVNGKNLGMYIITAATIVIAIAAVMLIEPLRRGITSGFRRMQKSPKKRKIFGIVLSCIAVIILAFTIYKVLGVRNQEDVRMANTGIVCYLMNTSFIFVPAAFIGIIVNGSKIAKDKNYLAIYISFLYIVFMYCDFMWVLIYKYFYYARYFTPYVCIVVLAGAILLNSIDFRIVIPVFLVCGGILISESSILYRARDLTTFDYEVVESMVSSIGKDDAVIVLDQGYDIAQVFALPVRSATGADIYFAYEYDLLEKIAYYEDYYEDVYVILYDDRNYTDEGGKWRHVYETKLKACYYDDFVDKGTPFPKEIIEMESPFALLIYESDKGDEE